MQRANVWRFALASLWALVGGGVAQAQEGQWNAYISTGWRLCLEDNAPDAKNYLLKALQQADAFPADDPRRALTLAYLAFTSFKQAQPALADGYSRQALAIYDRVSPGVPHPTVGKGLNALALTAQGRNDFVQADRLYQRAIAAERNAAGASKLTVHQLLANRASVLEAQGRFEEAEGLRKQQLDLLQATRQAGDVSQSAVARQQLAHLYRLWNRDESAEPLFRQAVATFRSEPKAAAQLADCLTDLGRLYLDGQDYKRAEPPLREALVIRTRLAAKLPPEKQSSLAEALHDVGTLALAVRNYDRAEPPLRDALAIREKASPDGDLNTAATLRNLGVLHVAQKRYAQAAGEFQRAMAITEKVRGRDHVEVAAAVESLASLYVVTGNIAEADRCFRRALTIRETALGMEHPGVAATLHNFANFYRDQKRYADAEPLYQRALAVKEKALGLEHPSLAPLLDNYAQLLRQTNRAGDAAKLKARANALEAKTPSKSGS